MPCRRTTSDPPYRLVAWKRRRCQIGDVASINQTGTGIRLPNFCNLGVMLRALVVVNALLAAAAILRAATLAEAWPEFMLFAALGEPILIVSLAVLCAVRRGLHAIGYWASILAVGLFELLVAWLVARALGGVLPLRGSLTQMSFLVLFITGCTILYFDLRSRALAPAIAEARIQALQARIRPHFLYNSINAVPALMRSEPRRAERALEDMADLFRVLMSDNRTLAPIGQEIELAKQYLAIESIRLGERLRVTWRTDGVPPDALVPPLMLQPLVENAVYHGIEPSEAGGEIVIEAAKVADRIVLSLANPCPGAGRITAGEPLRIAN